MEPAATSTSSSEVPVAHFASLTLAALILDRAFALLMTVLMSAAFGAGSRLDVYLVAVAGPTVISILLGDMAYSLLLPEFMRIRCEPDAASETWGLIGFATVMLFLLTVAYACLWTVSVLALRGDGDLLRLGLTTTPLILFVGISAVGATALIAADRYLVASMRFPVSSLVSIIAFLILLGTGFGVFGLALSVVTGALGAAVLVTAMLVGIIRRPFLRFRRAVAPPYAKRLRRASVALFLTGAVSQASTPIERLMGLWLGGGVVSSLNYGRVLVSPPLLLSQSVATASYPKFVGLKLRNSQGLSVALSRAIGMVIFLALPISILLIVITGPLVDVVYHRGAFDHQAVVRTTVSAAILAAGVVPISISAVVIRFIYATRGPAKVTVVTSLSLGVYILMALVLGLAFNYPGLAMASTLSGFATALAVLAVASRDNSLGWSLVPIRSILSAVSGGLGMAVCMIVARSLLRFSDGLAGRVEDLVVATFVGCAAYGAIAYVLRSRDLLEVLSYARRSIPGGRRG